MYFASPEREDVAKQLAWTVGIWKNNISPPLANAHRSCLVLEEICCWVQRIPVPLVVMDSQRANMASPPLANAVLLFQLRKKEYCIVGTWNNNAPPPLANAYLACLMLEEMCCRAVSKS
jgi:hypothetical protein